MGRARTIQQKVVSGAEAEGVLFVAQHRVKIYREALGKLSDSSLFPCREALKSSKDKSEYACLKDPSKAPADYCQTCLAMFTLNRK